MYVKLKIPIGTMAVKADEAQRTAEFLDVDAISLQLFTVNSHESSASFALALGGIDSKGQFHLDPAHRDDLAHIVIASSNDRSGATKRLFDGLFADEQGNPKSHYPREFLKQLMRDIVVPKAYQVVWGATFPDMEVLMDGELIFQPDHLKPKPPTPAAPPKPARVETRTLPITQTTSPEESANPKANG